jgi:hypothetical protein
MNDQEAVHWEILSLALFNVNSSEIIQTTLMAIRFEFSEYPFSSRTQAPSKTKCAEAAAERFPPLGLNHYSNE